MSTPRQLSIGLPRPAPPGAALFAVLVAFGCSTTNDSNTGDGADQVGTGGVGSAVGSGGMSAAPGSGGSTAVGGSGGVGVGSGGSTAIGTGGTAGGMVSGTGGSSSMGSGGMQAQNMGTGGTGMMMQDAGSRDSGSDAAVDAGGTGPLKKFVGNITTQGAVRDDFTMYWDQITPENEGKWGSVEGTRDQMNWTGLDRVHDYAKQHNIPFKQHNFVWGSQQPSWLNGLSQADQRAEVEEWIRLFCERYPDTQLIDVVNEPPPHTTPPYTAALGGAGASGYDWIVQAFKWARQYCPNSILIMNDYNIIEYADQNTNFINIVKAIQAAGAPIDAVGVQAHALTDLGGQAVTQQSVATKTASVKALLDKIASETGLPIYVSEYDIDIQNDQQQQWFMEANFTMFWDDPAVKGITLWGYITGATWRNNTGLMSSSGQQRPAMMWLMNFLQTHP